MNKFGYCRFFSYINSMKKGDKVNLIGELGEWELVWYKKSDSTCAIQNKTTRRIVKTSILKPIK